VHYSLIMSRMTRLRRITPSVCSTALHRAVMEEDLKTCERLLEEEKGRRNHTMMICTRDVVGWEFPLHIAARVRGGVGAALVKLLIDHRADVDVKNSSNMSALYMSVYRGNVKSVELLLEAKAGMQEPVNTLFGYNVFTAKIENNQECVIALLSLYGVSPSGSVQGVTRRIYNLFQRHNRQPSAWEVSGCAHMCMYGVLVTYNTYDTSQEWVREQNRAPRLALRFLGTRMCLDTVGVIQRFLQGGPLIPKLKEFLALHV
jgi:hypothetical protein